KLIIKDGVFLVKLVEKVKSGDLFRHTKLNEVFNYKEFEKEKEEEAVFLYFIKPSTRVYFYADDMRMTPAPGDVIVSLTTPQKEVKKIKKKLESNGSS